MSNKNDNPQSGQGRPLPKKEADLFKNVVKFYESKQYKKGLKNAETILKRFPNHGETLCMKGLIVNALGNADKKVRLDCFGVWWLHLKYNLYIYLITSTCFDIG
jgi:hypothetical protein